ncbi:hypothetical protein KC324_g15 [Hortaea werneckii]|nr:hypothetical protein KC324_g15 [Hortaea werneckii]
MAPALSLKQYNCRRIDWLGSKPTPELTIALGIAPGLTSASLSTSLHWNTSALGIPKMVSAISSVKTALVGLYISFTCPNSPRETRFSGNCRGSIADRRDIKAVLLVKNLYVEFGL